MKKPGTSLSGPTDAESLDVLRNLLPPEVPSDYFSFLSRHDGGDFWPGEGDWAGLGFDYLAIDNVRLAIESQRRGIFSASPELVVIGSDGAGQWLAYDTRKPHPWPLIMYCPGAPEHSNCHPVARSIDELLLKYTPK